MMIISENDFKDSRYTSKTQLWVKLLFIGQGLQKKNTNMVTFLKSLKQKYNKNNNMVRKSQAYGNEQLQSVL